MRQKSVKKLACFLVVIVLLAALSISASAKMSVSSMDITVTLNQDGSAVVEQVWETYANENTEFYYPFGTGKYLELSDFSVADETRAYTVVDDWDVDASFEDKAYKCGLLPVDGGYEVCWGVSNYGSNRYTVKYTVHNMVGSYTDTDGFLFRFVNQGMNTTPTDVSLTIRMADGAKIIDKTCNIWAFGYDGDIVFENGGIKAETYSAIEYDNHLTLMVEFDKGVLSPVCTKDGAFADVKALAFEDGDYDPNAMEDIAGMIIFIVMMSAMALFVGAVLVVVIAWRIGINKFIKKCDYHRDIPLGGDLNAAAKLATLFHMIKEENLIGAYLLGMINAGCIRSLATAEVHAFGKTKKNTDLLLVAPPANDYYAKRLYDILERGADENGCVSEKAMKQLCKKEHGKLRAFLNVSLTAGEQSLEKNDYSHRLKPAAVKHLTDVGRAYLAEIAGFKKYLEDFSLLDEHEIGAAAVWQDYMVWAVLLGVADKVIKELRDLYPERVEEWDAYDRRVVVTRGYYHGMYSSMRAREQEIQAQRSSGSGGRASFGGGGGFSGGGFGGGGR